MNENSPAWALGFDVGLLKEIAAAFKSELSPHCYGAFGVPKERDIANAMQSKEIIFSRNPDCAAAIFKLLKSKSTHGDFSETVEAHIQPGDLFIKSICGSFEQKAKLLRVLSERSKAAAIWVEVHDENIDAVLLLRELGFSKVLTKVSASSDIKGLYLRGDFDGRVSGDLAPEEKEGLKCLEENLISTEQQQAIIREILAYESLEPWAQHYSSYNKRQSWTAFSIRGFDKSNPGFIIKPAEMSKAWKAENPARLLERCDWTSAAPHFKETIGIIESLIPCEFERFRLMRLSSKGGELSRHADITDKDAGLQPGKIARLHIPIKTAPGCKFLGWDASGTLNEKFFHERGLFYLDTRKPHSVINNSDSERIHIVVDAFSNDWLRSLLRDK